MDTPFISFSEPSALCTPACLGVCLSASTSVVVFEPSLPGDTLHPWLEADPRVAIAGFDRFADIARAADYLGADHVILVARRSAAKVRLTATTLSGARPRIAVATRVVPTTALALAASAVTALEYGPEPTSVLHAFDHLVTQSHSGVTLDRVAKLESPKPGLGLHLRSLVSRGFVAMTTPEPRVGRVMPQMPNGAPVLIAAEPGSPQFDACARRVAASNAQSVPAIVGARAAYGSRGADVIALTSPPMPTGQLGTCSVCGAGQVGRVCGFCHVTLRFPEAA